MYKITVIHGQLHKGSTYNITKQIIDKIDIEKEVEDYFMPTDTPNYCIGCYKCFEESENNCPHAEKVQRIVKSMESSDIIVFNSPTYCYGITGQLKTFLDHLGYMWIAHRPNEAMFNKVGIVVSTASGAGGNKVTKSLAQQMFWLGIPNVFKYSKTVNASSWETVPKKIKKTIEKDTDKLSKKIVSRIGNAKPRFKLKFIFMMMRIGQIKNDWNMTDRDYWDKKGWLGNTRPW